MKLMLAAAILLVLSPNVHAQSLAVGGVNLSLGEAETKARSDLAANEVDIEKFGNTFTLRIRRGEQQQYDLVGDVAFKGGKVFWVQRDWYLNQTPNDKNVLATIFHNATASLLEGSDTVSCNVKTGTHDNSPNFGISKTTEIECIKPTYTHSLFLSGTDCSVGCSVGNVSGTLSEAIKLNAP